MSFLLPCPNCGPRDVNEFVCAGEVTTRPKSAPSLRELTSYVYFRDNVAGIQREWWFHRFGCELWFQAERDTRTNEVVRSELAAPGVAEASAAPEAAATPDAPAV
jgi:methylglutamate dehydrogenase subunit B